MMVFTRSREFPLKGGIRPSSVDSGTCLTAMPSGFRFKGKREGLVMNQEIVGIGVLKGGAYDTVVLQGIGAALETLNVHTLRIQGIFKGKEVRQATEITMEGEARITRCDFADRLLMRGQVRIIGLGSDASSLIGEGEVTADRLQIGRFHLCGNCRIRSLQASEIQISNPPPSAKEKDSVIDEVVCDTLTAYRLKAKKVTAQHVELRGECEIDTLICPSVTVSGPECVIRHPIQDMGAES